VSKKSYWSPTLSVFHAHVLGWSGSTLIVLDAAGLAFAGAAVLIIGRGRGVPPLAAALFAGATCLLLRLLSVHFG
jgi:hypothetical protein